MPSIRNSPKAWIAEEVPSSAHRAARFENSIAIMRQFALDSIRGIDTRDARTDNEHIIVSFWPWVMACRTHHRDYDTTGLVLAAQTWIVVKDERGLGN